jgi:hypothetical protein
MRGMGVHMSAWNEDDRRDGYFPTISNRRLWGGLSWAEDLILSSVFAAAWLHV